MDKVPASKVADSLGVSIGKLKILEKQGLLHPIYDANGEASYSPEEISRINRQHTQTLSEEAALVGIGIQRDIASSVTFFRKVLIIAGVILSVYILLVVVFTTLFVVAPLQAAQWTGIINEKQTSSYLLTHGNQDNRVLAAETSLVPERTSPVKAILKPVGKTSLGIVKNISPDSYAKVSEVVIIDPNDVLELDADGSIVPDRPINLPDSSLLKVGSDDLVANLNSQYVQGRQPGTNAGDLAIVGETAAPIPAAAVTEITESAISRLTNESLSGSAGITNDNLANPAITVETSGPLSGGGEVSLGGILTLDCPNCVIDDDSLFTSDSTDTVTNKTIDADSNTISGLTESSLEAGDFSNKITSGTYSINITGSVATATDFTGLLAGDVTGTQGSTTVEKINGNTLGLTTPVAGNFLIGDGSSWITQAISNDATIDSSGVLTLKSVGTAGSYGSATSIPVLTTDAEGRVSGVTDTAISGLTVSNFGSANISQWTNDSGFITDGNSGWDNSYGFITSADDTVSGLELDGVFPSTGILVRTGAATYSTITDNSSNWDTAFSHSGATTNVHGLTFTSEGTGGGLDADTVDGLDATAFATAGHNHDGSYLTSLSIPSDLGDIDGDFASGLTVEDDSHNHTSSTISGLTITNFSSANISQWTNDSGFITDGNINWDNGYGFILSSSTDILTNKTISAGSNSISGLTDANLSGSAGIANANLANSALTVTAGSGLINGGSVSLGGSTALDIGAGNGITVNANDLALNLTTSGTTGSTSSNSGLEVSPSGLTLLKGCADNEILKWTDAGGWACSPDQTGSGGSSDLQHAASYDTNQALVNVASSQVTLGTVSVTPATATGDVYVTGFAEVRSSNATDQPFHLVIETTNNCSGSTVGNATVTYTITAGANTTVHLGNIRVSGIAVDPGTSAQPYSLCASTATGDTDVLNWGIEATVIDTGADLAEIYTTNDNDIEVGDVVSLDSDLQTGMKKSHTAYDKNVIGVVSTNPGLVIGGIDKEGVNAMPVALSGRVPVKVSTQNGAISAGDYLTTSATPGVAMKATEDGAIIGTAMSSFDEEDIGQILVFVKNGSSTGQNNNAANDETESEANENLAEQISQVISDLFKDTLEFFGNVIFHSDVTFAGRPTFNNDTAGHVSIDADDSEVEITFEEEYEQKPIVTASVNLEDNTNISDIPEYAIYDLSSKGFKIKLSETVDFDLDFSWVALSVNSD